MPRGNHPSYPDDVGLDRVDAMSDRKIHGIRVTVEVEMSGVEGEDPLPRTRFRLRRSTTRSMTELAKTWTASPSPTLEACVALNRRAHDALTDDPVVDEALLRIDRWVRRQKEDAS